MPSNETSPPLRKTPPFLLAAALLFWGWQSDLLIASAVMAAVLESARFFKARWDLSEPEFRRIWNFCTLLAFTLVVYAFTNEEIGAPGGLLHGISGLHNVTITTARTATAFLRWLPMIFFLVVAAQVFSLRETMPLTAISLLLRRHRAREMKNGRAAPPRHSNITYPYFIICLFSAGIHPNEGTETFFWGQSILVIWALWTFRSRRFKAVAWLLVVAAVIVIGYFGQFGIRQLQSALEGSSARWLARLFHPQTDPAKTMTAIGSIGKLKLSGRIVIRLHTENGRPPPTYLREASYRRYNGSARRPEWYAGSPRNDFSPVLRGTNQTTWILLNKKNTASVNIACYLNGRDFDTGDPSGLLPLPTGSALLENLYAYIVQKNSEGAVLADGPQLLIFDALYSPGATVDLPPDSSTNRMDLIVPTNEIPALSRVISENKLQGRDERQTLLNVYGFFGHNFTYSLWQRPRKSSRHETALTRFLLTNRSGHCEYFATATVLLLRELNIPARYAVGYLVHENSGGDSYVVRERDAHSWCLVWNEKTKMWEDFDTTPGSWIENERISPWQKFLDFCSWIHFEIAKLKMQWGQGHFRDYILLGLIPILLFLLYQIIFRHGRARRRTVQKKSVETFFWPGLDSEFYELEKKLTQRGLPRRLDESLSDWLSRALTDSALADSRAPLNSLLQLHYRYRFDPHGLEPAERDRLSREVKTRLEELSHERKRH